MAGEPSRASSGSRRTLAPSAAARSNGASAANVVRSASTKVTPEGARCLASASSSCERSTPTPPIAYRAAIRSSSSPLPQPRSRTRAPGSSSSKSITSSSFVGGTGFIRSIPSCAIRDQSARSIVCSLPRPRRETGLRWHRRNPQIGQGDSLPVRERTRASRRRVLLGSLCETPVSGLVLTRARISAA